MFLGCRLPPEEVGDLESDGAELVQACIEKAEADGQDILLVGDTDYFGRFGFARASGVRLPGPVDAGRVLWRGADAPEGLVRPAP